MTGSRYAENLDKLLTIGTALSSERNLDKLLEMILDLARELTIADAGTLYLVDDADKALEFKIAHNESLGTRVGGTSGIEPNVPPVPLQKDGEPNLSNVSAYAANTNELVNIQDVYAEDESTGFDFVGPRNYDKFFGYHTKSMLSVPMKDHEDEIIGVLQLINAKDEESGELIPFRDEYVALSKSLASQAAVALTNAKLIKDLKALFDSFIKSTAGAIERKSPYTGGHIRRVAMLTMMIAKKVNEMTEGPYADVNFSEDELDELRIAAWMHDLGKITTPVHVVDKATKLEAIFDRIELIRTRFDVIFRERENEALQEKVVLLSNGGVHTANLQAIEEALQKDLSQISDDLDFLVLVNQGGEFMEAEKIDRLHNIAQQTFILNGKAHPYLTENEVYNLGIKKGTLNNEDRKKIEEHALVSIEMLRELPFPRKLAKVSEY
ncbi:uncharacterized protein METZ01_LOCUS247096, partial [marine metagenome]